MMLQSYWWILPGIFLTILFYFGIKKITWEFIYNNSNSDSEGYIPTNKHEYIFSLIKIVLLSAWVSTITVCLVKFWLSC